AMAKQLQARRLDGIDYNPWVEFVKLASEHDVVNLGQGFPDFPPPDFAVEAFQHAVSGDFMLNQYTKTFVSLCYPGWSAMVRSWSTAALTLPVSSGPPTSASGVTGTTGWSQSWLESSFFDPKKKKIIWGYPPLTKILASFFGELLGQEIDPLRNVLVTV
ncbi:kynurenine aminotransferase 1, partial [Homo sapiens]